MLARQLQRNTVQIQRFYQRNNEFTPDLLENRMSRLPPTARLRPQRLILGSKPSPTSNSSNARLALNLERAIAAIMTDDT